jgi:PAS domain-containing protein
MQPMLVSRIGVLTFFRGTRCQMLHSGETEERFRLLLEAAPNGMIVTDHDGVITFVNRQVEKLFGYSR